MLSPSAPVRSAQLRSCAGSIRPMSDGDGEIHKADSIGKREGRRLTGRQIGAIAIGAFVVLFALLNLEDASVDLLVKSVKMPLFVVIAVCAALGFGSGFLVARHRARHDD